MPQLADDGLLTKRQTAEHIAGLAQEDILRVPEVIGQTGAVDVMLLCAGQVLSKMMHMDPVISGCLKILIDQLKRIAQAGQRIFDHDNLVLIDRIR